MLTADRFEVAAYLIVLDAALIRVLGGMLFADAYTSTIIASRICWPRSLSPCTRFATGQCCRARLDSKPG